MYVLLLPTLQLLPLEALGVPGLNWQTVFLIIFVVAAAAADQPPSRLAVSSWITYLSIILILAAVHGWAHASETRLADVHRGQELVVSVFALLPRPQVLQK